MILSETAGAAVTAFRRHTAGLVPFYLLGAAVPAIARVGTFVGAALLYLYLEVTGRLATVRTEIAAVDVEPPDPEVDPDAFAEYTAELAAALEPLATPVVGGLVVLTILVTILASVVLSATVSAGQIGASLGALRDRRAAVDGIAGVRDHWLTFLGLVILEIVLWLTTAAAIAVVVAVAAFALTAAGAAPVAALFVALGVLAWLAVGAVIRAVFAFAPVAAVVDDVGVVASLSATGGFLRRRPVEALFYYVVAFVALVGFLGTLSALAVVGAAALVPLVTAFLVWPLLDLLKTALFGRYRGAIPRPTPIETTIRSQLRGGIARGWRELVGFVRATPALHALAVATMVGGFLGGWVVAGPLVGLTEASIEARLEGIVPPVFALELFGNNWTVAFTTAFAGLALAVPALVSLAFNGFVFGIVGRLEVDPAMLVAFVTPHGILEIPAIFVAGALGTHLGIVYWRTLRGPLGRAELATELERAFRVVVGLGIVLGAAALIEAFVSPFYFRPFL